MATIVVFDRSCPGLGFEVQRRRATIAQVTWRTSRDDLAARPHHED